MPGPAPCARPILALARYAAFTELRSRSAPVGVEHELTYNRGVPPVLNDDVATALLASAAQSIDPQAT